MTTLAAIQGDGWCVIAADSLTSNETGHTSETPLGKIFKNGPALIAGAGALRGINIMQFGWKAPALAGRSTDVYITKSFIPEMRKAFIESGYDMKADSEAAQHDNTFLVAVDGVLYSIDEDYSWERCSRNIYVAGSGGDYALGALALQGADKAKSIAEATRMLNKAVRVAICYDAFSGGDVTIVSQGG